MGHCKKTQKCKHKHINVEDLIKNIFGRRNHNNNDFIVIGYDSKNTRFKNFVKFKPNNIAPKINKKYEENLTPNYHNNYNNMQNKTTDENLTPINYNIMENKSYD